MSKNTRGANGSGYIRKRPDGRWEAMYSAGYDEKTGKLIRKSIYGKTQKEVRQKLTKVQIEIDEGTYLEPSKMTLSEWIDMWLKEYTFDKKYSTLKGYKAQIKKHIKPGLGNYNLSQLNPMLLQRFFNRLSEPDDEGNVLSAKSIKNVHIILSGILEQAVENELIAKNPSFRQLCQLSSFFLFVKDCTADRALIDGHGLSSLLFISLPCFGRKGRYN